MRAKHTDQSVTPVTEIVVRPGQATVQRHFYGHSIAALLALACLAAQSVFGQIRGEGKQVDKNARSFVALIPAEGVAKTGLGEQRLWANERYPFPATKLDHGLRLAWQTAIEQGKGAALTQLIAGRATLAANGEDVVTIVSPSAGTTIEQLGTAVRAVGATIIRSGPDAIKAVLPIERLSEAAQLQEVARIRNLLPPREKNVTTTEGLSATLANAWHTAGHRGSGVKVAVVDMGFANLATLKAQDEIPSAATEVNYTASGMTAGSSSHGSACAEIVYDMAPQAQMYLIKIDDPTDLLTVKDYCIAQGINVVSFSVGWDALNFHDGMAYANWFTTAANHPVTAVDLATSAGILWVNAAGNEQLQHTLIDWRDGNADTAIDWNSDYDAFNILYLNGSDTIPAGTVLDLYMTWNEWPTTSQDFDLQLYYWTGTAWSRVTTGYIDDWYGDDTQNGTTVPYPYEEIINVAPYTATYAVVVKSWSTTTTPKFILRCYGISYPTYNVYNSYDLAPGSICIPGDAASAFTVGAIDYALYTTGPIEGFSSLGPNNRAYTGGTAVTKPDICGPDFVTSVSYGSQGFSGTSAATPHIGGLAALVKGAYPSYTLAQLKQYIETNRYDLGTTGKDNTYGAGAARLPTPPAGTAPEMDVQGNSVSIVDGDNTPSLADHTDFGSALVAGGTVVRTYTIRNTGTATLNLTGTPRVAVSGTHATNFIVSTQPAATVAAGGTNTFQVRFDPSAVGARTAVLSIANNDANENPYDFSIRGTGEVAGTIQLGAASYAVNEGAGRVTATVTRTGGSFGAATVNFATAGGTATAAEDYIATNGTLTWTSGDTASKQIVITIVQDAIDELNETIGLALSGVTGATLGSPASATITIMDDETQRLVVAPERSSCYLDGTGDYLSIPSDQLLSNSSFEVWSGGDTSAPNSWVLGGTNVSIAKSAAIKRLGAYAAKVTSHSSVVQLYQAIHAAKGIAYWRGRTVTVGAWVYATNANCVRIAAYDGIGLAASPWHTGDSTWQYLTATKQINSTGTWVSAHLQVFRNGSEAYVDDAFLSDDATSTFNWGTDPFTIDLWIHPTLAVQTQVQRIVCQQASTNYWVLQITTAGKLQWVGSGGLGNMTGATVLSNGTWQHVEVSRNGTGMKLRLDGVEDVSATVSDSARAAEDSVNIQIGTWNSTRYFTGYLDEIRVSKGIARHTADFAPSQPRHTPDAYTRLMLHFDGEHGSSIMTDSSVAARPVTAAGDASISTSKYCALYLAVPEGGDNSNLTVRLAVQPSANVAVTVARTSGDANLNVASGANLTFTPANWNVPQAVTITAAEDADHENGTAVFTVASSGLASRTVPVMEVDEDMEVQTVDHGVGDSVVIRWSSLTNRLYILHHSTDLKTGFSVLETGIPSTPPINTYTDSLNGSRIKFWSVSTEE